MIGEGVDNGMLFRARSLDWGIIFSSLDNPINFESTLASRTHAAKSKSSSLIKETI